MSIQPAITLAELFGPGVVYVPRRSPSLHGWSPMAPGFVDFQTGHQLAVAGPIPYVACAGVATADIVALYAEAGLSMEADLHLYRSAREYMELIDRFRRDGIRLAIQRVHPADEVPDAIGVTPLSLQEDLNDKGRMADVVPADWLPRRRIVDVAALPSAPDLLGDGAVVLKAATRLPNGGGHCVWVCRTPADVDRARAALGSERFVIVEEFLDLRRTVCVHAVVRTDGTAILVGAAEEVCEGERYTGNWFDADAEDVPSEVRAVVQRIVEAAASRGYRGIVGIDVAFVADGPPLVLDLNFRVNGSTAAAWLREGLRAGRRAECMRLRGWTATEPAELFRRARQAIERGVLVPLGAYDPRACEMGGVARLHGLLVGPTRGAVMDEDHRLARAGLE